jgi:hypothetical protein
VLLELAGDHDDTTTAHDRGVQCIVENLQVLRGSYAPARPSPAAATAPFAIPASERGDAGAMARAPRQRLPESTGARGADVVRACTAATVGVSS